MDPLPETRYTRSGDVTIAYQVFGDGVPVVWVPGFISHVELNWETPFFGGAFRRSARYARVATFDKRGTGLSDHTAAFGSLEERMDDIRAVMDAVGFERATIGGMSEGGPLAILFAATYPERVEKLLLYGTFAVIGPDIRPAVDALAARIEKRWGSGEVLSLFAQHAPDPVAERALMARLERYTATPARAAEIIRRLPEIDVRPVLGSVQAPTLVLHCARDPMMPVTAGRYLAEHIPTCDRFVELDRDFHTSWLPSDVDLLVDSMEEFITGRITSRTDDTERILTTVLFTDIVDSTARAEAMGDTAWRTLLDRHDAIVREEVERSRGRVVKTTGDGVLASFDGPARGVRAAQAIAARVRALAIDVRAAVHTGECEVRGNDLAGIAVHVAARLLALAGTGEVVASRTVRDLVSGSGLEFEPRGSHAVKGVSEPIDVYSVRG